MINFTSEYKYYNINFHETCNIVENTLLKHERKHTVGCRAMVKVECIAQFLDKIKNEVKIITIQKCMLNEELKKVLQSSEGMVILVRIDKKGLLSTGWFFKVNQTIIHVEV